MIKYFGSKRIHIVTYVTHSFINFMFSTGPEVDSQSSVSSESMFKSKKTPKSDG